MDRITFPLFDLEGRIMGFSARVWPPTDTTRPKYYNSAASPTFWKSLTLYGLYQALDSIKKDNFALVVEGNLDVIQLHANDLTHAVAPCGTALTKEQLLMLVRLTDRIIFCFDADTAGINATAKVKKLCEESNVTFMSFSLDGAKDPDEFIRLYGAQPIIDTIKGLLRDYNKGREKSGR
jgi:DNA primase